MMSPEMMSGGSNAFSLDSLKKKLLWKKRSLNLTDRDPVYKVIYLGNVLTPWAKGEGCVDKPLATLWKNYCSNVKSDIFMKLTICASGIKAITREHGLTEYWSNRITYCFAHPKYPRVFCWIYRHEGRKLKQELRCHAVLCSNEVKAVEAAKQLSHRITSALHEYRKEKSLRENARLLQQRNLRCLQELIPISDTIDASVETDDLVSVHETTSCGSTNSYSNSSQKSICSTNSSLSSASSCSSSSSGISIPVSSASFSDKSSSCESGSNRSSLSSTVSIFQRKQPSPSTGMNSQIPVRKKHLIKGSANFRPPLERSKSAPRLNSIHEVLEEEEDDDDSVDGDDFDDNRILSSEGLLDRFVISDPAEISD